MKAKEENILHLVRVPNVLAKRVIKEKVDIIVYNLMCGGNNTRISELKEELREEKYQETQKMRIYFRPKFDKVLREISKFDDLSIQDTINIALLLTHKEDLYGYLKPLPISTK